MQTIDLSWITVTDLKGPGSILRDRHGFKFEDWGFIGGIFEKEFSLSDDAVSKFHVFFDPSEGTFSLDVFINKDSVISQQDVSLKAYPISLKGFPAVKQILHHKAQKAKEYFALFTANINTFDELNQQIIRAFSAQSKEDFYDDASDYQDDEPTDFGDASNYDENLVRRIRKLIE